MKFNSNTAIYGIKSLLDNEEIKNKIPQFNYNNDMCKSI